MKQQMRHHLLITNIWFNVRNMNTYNTPFLFQQSSTICSCNFFCLCSLPLFYLGAYVAVRSRKVLHLKCFFAFTFFYETRL